MPRGLARLLFVPLTATFSAAVSACAVNAVRTSSIASSPSTEAMVAPSIDSAVRGAGGPSPSTPSACGQCMSASLTAEEVAAIERRIAELRAKGGVCSTYSAVLERSYRAGQITIRPYMWRVGAQLASGEARPDGAIYLAREIDSLNVGRRPFDELVWTMEHEAAHIAFNLDSPLDRGPGDRADAVVRSCKG